MKTTVIVLIAIVILGGVAIFTATRIYQLRNQNIAPNAPENVPAATIVPTQTPTSSPTTLPIVGSEETTSTATPTATRTPRPTPSATAKPVALPSAGVSWPTLMGILSSVFFIITAILLIF